MAIPSHLAAAAWDFLGIVEGQRAGNEVFSPRNRSDKMGNVTEMTRSLKKLMPIQSVWPGVNMTCEFQSLHPGDDSLGESAICTLHGVGQSC